MACLVVLLDPMDDLLTTRQLQELLQIDRVTIYRMLEDGRLRGFKVGGQWRFSRHDIETWLQGKQDGTPDSGAESDEVTPAVALSSPLPLVCVQAIQDVFSEACETAAITISTDGTSLTDLSFPCEFCRQIVSTTEGRRRCQVSWQTLARRQSASNRCDKCHAGLAYLCEPVEIDGSPAAFILAGQLATEPFSSDDQIVGIRQLAHTCHIDTPELIAAAQQVPVRTQEDVERISRLIKRTSYVLSEIGHERSLLLKRLQRIAEMTVLD